MSKVKVGLAKPLVQSCGVGEIGLFRKGDEWDCPSTAPTIDALEVTKLVSGCGWLIASFTPKVAIYKEAYEDLVKRFGEPLFQSDVRVNKRTNNKFFFCIFDAKDKE